MDDQGSCTRHIHAHAVDIKDCSSSFNDFQAIQKVLIANEPPFGCCKLFEGTSKNLSLSICFFMGKTARCGLWGEASSLLSDPWVGPVGLMERVSVRQSAPEVRDVADGSESQCPGAQIRYPNKSSRWICYPYVTH